MRVLPRENEAVNECWLADRDRFSYEALNSAERLEAPMIRRGHQWEPTDWNTALEFTLAGLNKVVQTHGASQLGALAAPTSTLEEFYLLQKLMRALGSGNIDHRLRQLDFGDDEVAPVSPGIGQALTDLETIDAALLIGANPRKDQPLINWRLRKGVLKGAQVLAINSVDYDFNYPLAHKRITDLAGMQQSLAALAAAVATLKHVAVPPELVALVAGPFTPGTVEQAMAEVLTHSRHATVLLGNFALSHPHAATLKACAQFIAETCGARLGQLPAANAAGAWLAGCVPHRGVAGAATLHPGRHALDMLLHPLKAYLLLGVEPEFDCLNSARAVAAMQAAEFVVMCTSFKPSLYKSRAVEYADVWLPLAAFTETAGTFVNAEGRRQAFQGVVEPPGQARPGWKILRVLGNLFGLPGFDQMNIEDVRREIDLGTAAPTAKHSAWPQPSKANGLTLVTGQVMRLAEVPVYAVDALTRRAASLTQTADHPRPGARLNAHQAQQLGLAGGDAVRVVMREGEARLDVLIDARVPDGCVLVYSGFPETAGLGAHGPASIVRDKL
jgi:NADH-quinone oxidoreductase subunit G